MDIKIDEFKQLFFSELDKKLIPLGFKYVKSKHGYLLKNKENWNFRFLIDCVKWRTSIGITTKISTRNLLIEKTFNKLCGTKYEGLKIWGEYPLISKFLGQQHSEKPLSTFCVCSVEDISKITQSWFEYFENIGIPFIERITTEKHFSLNVVLEYEKTFFFPDRCRYLPIMCKQQEMSSKEIELICDDLESEFDDFLKLEHLSKEFQERWVSEYYKVKNFVLNNELPSP